MSRLLRVLVPFCALLLAVGCNNFQPHGTIPPESNVPPPVVQENTISGIVFAGLVNGATINAFSISDTDGSDGTNLGTATTDASGAFTVSLSTTPSGLVRVEATGGTYTSEYDGSTVSNTAKFTVLVPSASSNPTGIVVSYISSLEDAAAVGMAKGAKAQDGTTGVSGSVSGSLPQADTFLLAFFGLSSSAVIRTLAPAFDAASITSNPDGFTAGMVKGAVLDCAAAASKSDPGAYMTALFEDIVDLLWDGEANGTPVPLGSGTLASTAGTTDFLFCLNDYVVNGAAIKSNGITATEVAPLVNNVNGGVTNSVLTPKSNGLNAGSSGAISTAAFGGAQYLFIAARSQGVVVVDITDPTNPTPTVKAWTSVYTTNFNKMPIGGVVPIVGRSSHPQVLVFAYATTYNSPSRHVAILNAQLLATGDPASAADQAAIVDEEFDLTLKAAGPVQFSGGLADVAGGIPDPQRHGVWLATSDGYLFVDVTTTPPTQGTLYPVDTGQFLAENLGGDITHGLLLTGNYDGVQLIDLNAQISYDLDQTYQSTNELTDIDADSIDSNYQVGIITKEDEPYASFINLGTIVKTPPATPGASGTFIPATSNGFAQVALGSGYSPTISGSAVDSTTHYVTMMAGYSVDVAVGQIANPAASGTWPGLNDWVWYTIPNSPEFTGWDIAKDPHAVGAVYNLQTKKGYGYLLDGSTFQRALQIDMDAFYKMTRSTTDPHQPLGDPGASGGPFKAITWGVAPMAKKPSGGDK